MSTNGMMAAIAQAAGVAEEKQAEFVLDAKALKAGFPALAAELRAEGANLERERILYIERAALPGHDKIVAEHKADPTKSPADCAMAIIAAERETRGKQLAALDADEAKLKGLRSEPANGNDTPKAPVAALEGEAKWKAEWAADPKLHDQFSGENAYLSLRKMEDEGRVKVFGKTRAA